jgi:hypothetical protein
VINGLAKDRWLQVAELRDSILLNPGKITMFTDKPENISFCGRLYTAILAGKIINWR